MKKLLFIGFIFSFLVALTSLFFVSPAHAAASVLNFSDLTSGPKAGNTDTAGGLDASQHGAIVTVWGNNLGSAQGSSKIYFKDSTGTSREAVHVYYWKNADGQLPGGPANLYAYHKMQEIAFSLPSNVADGVGKIYVEVNGASSNELDFTIRSGNIRFVKTTGNDSTGDGSWDNPWKTVTYRGASSKMFSGDITYVGDGVQELNGVSIQWLSDDHDGKENLSNSIVAYPDSRILAQPYIGNYNSDGQYWNFAKWIVKTDASGINSFKGMRAVANEITNHPDYVNHCADGWTGVISGGGSGGKDTVSNVKALGNYIHDVGCDDQTTKMYHVFYLSNRGRSVVRGTDGNPYSCLKDHTSSADTRPVTGANWQEYWESGGYSSPHDWVENANYFRSYLQSYELGWNYLTDNKPHHALHVYDEGMCGDFYGVMKIHDNVVKNQVGDAVGISSAGYNETCFSMPVEIYNNLFINAGLDIPACEFYGMSGHRYAIAFGGETTKSHIRFYNNTTYGYGEEGRNGNALNLSTTFGGTLDFVNNIVFDTKNFPYQQTSYPGTPAFSGNNLWYNGGDSIPASPPAWDTSPLAGNPVFANATSGDFTLQSNSPAIGAGFDTRSVAPRDFLGNLRPATPSMGAYEYVSGETDMAPSSPTSLSVR